jgi:hypothetical protein
MTVALGNIALLGALVGPDGYSAFWAYVLEYVHPGVMNDVASGVTLLAEGTAVYWAMNDLQYRV